MFRLTARRGGDYAASFHDLRRFKEAKALMRKSIPMARRVLGDNNETTLRMRWNLAHALATDPGATLDDHREALNTFEDTAQTARRVLGGKHPTTVSIEQSLRYVRAILAARETPPGNS